MIDLHVHSTSSDGTFSPEELVDHAITKNLKAFALTDHDTVDGLEKAISYADSLRERYLQEGRDDPAEKVPEIIPGIELSSEYEGRDIHVVGLFIDYKNSEFLAYLKAFVESRELRNQQMCEKLQAAGIQITYEALLEAFPDSVITRAHYGRYMLAQGYVKSIKEAFDRYIGDHCPCFVPRQKVTPADAVQLILNAGGIPILAHPILYGMGRDKLESLVAELKEVGLIGIEAVYSGYSTSDERQIRSLAAKFHLLISGGSDFHGENKPDLDLGTGYGHLYIHDDILEDLRQASKNLLFTDMDGTLLRNNSTISAEMKAQLKRMLKSGHRLILSSGRPLPSILEVAEKEGIAEPGLFILSNNGALVYDYNKQAPIYECLLSNRDIAYIVQKAEEAGLHIHGYTDKEIVCHGMNAELTFYTRRIHMPLKCVTDIAAALPDGCYKLQLIHLTDKSKLEAFRKNMLTYCGDRIQMIFSNDQYLEILPAEAGKGNALRFVAEHLYTPISHCFAAGDAENDISMITAAGTGIAMANAADPVKKIADIITVKTNEEDGLLEIIASPRYFGPA